MVAGESQVPGVLTALTERPVALVVVFPLFDVEDHPVVLRFDAFSDLLFVDLPLEEIGLDLDVILNAGNAGYDYAFSDAQTPMIDPATGAPLLIPRQNSRLGFVPAVAAGGSTMTQTVPVQPWQGVGMVPRTGTPGPPDRSCSP